MTFTELEKSIHAHAEKLIHEEFEINAARFYHCSNQDAIDAITSTQTFRASFICSTSDSLEFSAPMAACRDFVCLANEIFQFPNFPFNLFKHFNEEAVEPTARPYFVSLSGNAQSAHIQSMYGTSQCEFELKTGSVNFEGTGYFMGVKYVDDIKAEVFRLMKRWQNEVLFQSFEDHGVKYDLQRMSDWFYTMMLFCNTISIGIKQKAFELEEEARIVVFPRTPDAVTKWHDPRATRPLSKNSLIAREYLPLKLDAMGIVAKV